MFTVETQAEALAARELVKVTYTNIKKPLLTIEDAILNDSHFPVPDNIMGLPTAAVKGDAEGSFQLYSFFFCYGISLKILKP